MSEVILLLYMTNLILLFTDIKNIKRWWPNNDFPLYDKTTLLRMCGLMCKRNGMPKDYGVVNWPYRAHILFMQKRMLDTNVNSMLKEVRVLYSLRKIRIKHICHYLQLRKVFLMTWALMKYCILLFIDFEEKCWLFTFDIVNIYKVNKKLN